MMIWSISIKNLASSVRPRSMDSTSPPESDPNGELTNFYTSGFGQGTTLTLYQLARAYSIFANDGKMVTPYWIDSIIDGDSSEVLYSANTEYSDQLISSDTVSQMKDLLYGVTHFEGGTGTRYQIDDSEITIIGKTGTGADC